MNKQTSNMISVLRYAPRTISTVPHKELFQLMMLVDLITCRDGSLGNIYLGYNNGCNYGSMLGLSSDVLDISDFGRHFDCGVAR